MRDKIFILVVKSSDATSRPSAAISAIFALDVKADDCSLVDL
jgi:hypothetical protein